MQMIQCPNCGKLSGFKRALGFGTFFMVVLTCGLWLLVIPFYPARCINCGLTRRSAVSHNFLVWYRGLSPAGKASVVILPILLFVGIATFNGIRGPKGPDATAADTNGNSVSPETVPVAATPENPADASTGGTPEDHELHLVPNFFGRGAVSDGRTYSVALISSYKDHIPPATTLFVQGTILGHFDVNVIVLADEQEVGEKLLCSMSSDESEDVNYYYHSGQPVQAKGDFHVGSLGLPVLTDCTIADPIAEVVRPLPATPAPEQPVEAPNQNSEIPGAGTDTQPQIQPAVAQSMPLTAKVTQGQTPDQVVAILGPPTSVTTGAQHIYFYSHLKVVFVDGKVSEIDRF